MVNAVNDFLPEPQYRIGVEAGAKVATPDILLSEEQVNIDTMADYIFPAIGGLEILSVSRSDLINSPYNNNYTPLLDAGNVFNNEIPIRVSDGTENVFNTYTINLNDHIPQGTTSMGVEPVESDLTSGLITINLKNLKPNYRVEIEILRDGQIVDDTIEGGV
jgi:hypothetical protein